MYIPSNTNINKNGNNTKNQAIFFAPALHIKFKIQVQNSIYINLIKKINVVLGTEQLYWPKQYVFTLPKFWNVDTSMNITETTK